MPDHLEEAPILTGAHDAVSGLRIILEARNIDDWNACTHGQASYRVMDRKKR